MTLAPKQPSGLLQAAAGPCMLQQTGDSHCCQHWPCNSLLLCASILAWHPQPNLHSC
jgi:hypothetical protein